MKIDWNSSKIILALRKMSFETIKYFGVFFYINSCIYNYGTHILLSRPHYSRFRPLCRYWPTSPPAILGICSHRVMPPAILNVARQKLGIDFSFAFFATHPQTMTFQTNFFTSSSKLRVLQTQIHFRKILWIPYCLS